MNKAEFIEKYGEEAYKKKLECNRKYCQNHREEINERAKKWAQEHKDRVKEQKRKWFQKYYQNHKEELSEKCISYAMLNYTRSGVVGRKRGQVRCIETGEIFDNSAEASRSLGLNIRAVANAIHRNCGAGGYHWEYVEE